MLSLGAVACSSDNENPSEQIIKVINDATEKVKGAKDAEETQKIATETGEKIKEISEKYPDYEATDDEKKKLGEATQAFVQASVEKTFQSIPKDELQNAANKIKEEAKKNSTTESE